MLNRDQINNILEERLNYPKHLVGSIVEKIMNMDSKLIDSFEAWLTNNKIPEYSVEDYTIETLMDKEKMSIISAFLTMDSLIKEPEIAKQALSYGIHELKHK